MAVRRNTFRKYVRMSLSGLLAVWLTGVVFLFCCGKIGAMPDADMGMSNDCPMSHTENTGVPFAASSSNDHVDCCGFLPAVFDKTRKVERDQQQVATASGLVVLRYVLPAIASHRATPISTHVRIGPQVDLPITNCVLRI